MNLSSFIAKTVVTVALVCSFVPTRSQVSRLEGVNWRTYKQGAFSNAKGTLTNVFETEGQFQNYWERVNGPIAGKMPTGGIDWSKEKLIAVNLGSRANPGYEVVVASIKRTTAGTIQVVYHEQLPMPGVNYPQVLVSPWVIVKMERVAGNIVFKGETVKRNTGVIYPPGGGDDCCGDRCRCCRNRACHGCREHGNE